MSEVVNVWGGERLRWWTSEVVNVWGGERLILHRGWWTSGVVNVWVVKVLQSYPASDAKDGELGQKGVFTPILGVLRKF